MLFFLACASPDPRPPRTETPPGYTSEVYSDPAHWLCHPDTDDDACDGDLTVTAIADDGSTTTIPSTPATDPAVDCFYVYPTNSLDDTYNSDLAPGVEEPWVAALQAARYREVCRVFAPMYRQVTVQGLLAGELGDFDLAYADVLDAFRHAIANGANHRPFLLVGHSQGSMHLARLLADEIEGDPALAGRLVAAHLIGGFVEVPIGEDVGGTFASTPLCRSVDETGCVVHWNAFRSDDPPGDDATFGLATVPGNEIACTLPWTAGEAVLSDVFPTSSPPEVAALIGPGDPPFADGSAVETPWYALPGLLRGECAHAGAASYLSITVAADPEDARADDIPGELLPGWGLHLVDVNLAQRDLVALAASEIAARGAR